eukprot:gene6852-13882_t
MAGQHLDNAVPTISSSLDHHHKYPLVLSASDDTSLLGKLMAK